MSDEPKTPTLDAEPSADLTTVPVWLFGLMLVLLFWGGMTFDQQGGWFNRQVYAPYHSEAELAFYQPPKAGDSTARGKMLYEANCALCHGVDGLGKPNQAPTLAGSEWVLTDGVNRLIRIPAVGLAGPLEVKGQQWNLAMAAMGAAYNDDDLAAVLSYVRNAWGNKASMVTPEQVAAVRKDIAGRTQPYTADELKKLPEK